MKVSSVTYSSYVTNSTYNKNFRGIKEEVISEGLKEFVSGALPVYKIGRSIHKLGEGDTKGAIKQGVGMVDNIVLQPAKQALAGTVAAKGAAIGSILGPVGSAIGAGIGYFGTLLFWGKTRNSIVDGIMDD